MRVDFAPQSGQADTRGEGDELGVWRRLDRRGDAGAQAAHVGGRARTNDVDNGDGQGRKGPGPGPAAGLGTGGAQAIDASDDRGGASAAGSRGPGRNLPLAIATGVGILAVALTAFAAGPSWAVVFCTVVVTLAAAETYEVQRRAGARPATLLGLVATVSLMLAVYWRGEPAVPLVFALSVVFSMLWFLFGVVRARPTVNIGATLLTFAWVGFLGSFSTLLLREPDRHGIAFLLGAVLTTAAHDIGSYVFGRRFGRRPIAPQVSPGKSLEGLMGGTLCTLLAAVLLVRAIAPWGFGSALALGLVVAVVAPLGDLCQSMIKRDLALKDMSGLLPGHGGVLDRFDALLFVLPATYYLVRVLDLGV